MSNDAPTQEEKKLSVELIDNFTQLITSGFGLVAALAWNEAIQGIFKKIFPAEQMGGLIAKIVYAVVITVLIVVFVYQMGKISNRIKRGIAKKGQSK